MEPQVRDEVVSRTVIDDAPVVNTAHVNPHPSRCKLPSFVCRTYGRQSNGDLTTRNRRGSFGINGRMTMPVLQ